MRSAGSWPADQPMPATALALLLLAAALHAAWNLLVKLSGDRLVVLWGANLTAALVGLPLLWQQGLSARGWGFAVVSAGLETAYFSLLAWAYRDGDFSLVYPLARGAAPALIAAGSVLLFGERLTGWGIAGGGLIVLGLAVIGRSAVSGPLRAGGRAVLAAGCVALTIAVYSLVDACAVRTSPAAVFVLAVYLLATLFLLPVALAGRGWRGLATGLRAASWRVPAVGLGALAAYVLVLSSYALAPVSYAAAVREVSIVFAALAGWRFLGEGFGRLRLAGSLLLFVGILLIAVGG